jgi:hypothetical protein
VLKNYTEQGNWKLGGERCIPRPVHAMTEDTTRLSSRVELVPGPGEVPFLSPSTNSKLSPSLKEKPNGCQDMSHSTKNHGEGGRL